MVNMVGNSHIVSFSGGKDSTALLFMMLDCKMPIDRIIFVDTTKEFPQMYEHIDLVEKKCGLKIERTKINFDYWFGDHIKTKGKMKGSTGYGWPDFRNRWCTALKIEAYCRVAYGIGRSSIGRSRTNEVEYLGITFDEVSRIRNKKDNGRNIKYPLVRWKIIGKQALAYCKKLGFTWGNLYDKFARVSCWCCPLQRMAELKCLYNSFPDLWKQMQNMDKKSFRKFTARYTVADLTKRFNMDNCNE